VWDVWRHRNGSRQLELGLNKWVRVFRVGAHSYHAFWRFVWAVCRRFKHVGGWVC
jgi:hypothetical protein